MLSELFQLARNLSGSGIETPLVHPDLDTPGLSGYTTLRVVLGERGADANAAAAVGGDVISDGAGVPVSAYAAQLFLLTQDDQAGLWTLKKGKYGFFPAVRLPATPLFSLPIDDERWPDLKKPSGELIRKLVGEARSGDGGLNLAAIHKQVDRILAWGRDSESDHLVKVKTFCRVFKQFSSDPSTAKTTLLDAVERCADLADERLRAALATVLVGTRKVPRNKPPTIEYKIQLCFDYRSPDQPGFTIYTAAMRQSVLETLNTGPIGEAVEATGGVCALTGRSMKLQQGPFPDWAAKPVISKPSKVFFKFSEAKCNYRYHRADRAAFDIGESTAKSLVGALKGITERQGINYRSLYNGRLERRNQKTIETKDVLIVYPSYSFLDLPLVDIFARDESSTEDETHTATKTFSDAAKVVLNAFDQPLDAGAVNASVVILAIREISAGQIQLAYSGMPSIIQFRSAIKAWKASGENLPERLVVPLPSKGSPIGYGWFRPRLLFPEEISRLLSHNWMRDGTESGRVAAPAVGDVLDLFLRKPGVWEATAKQLLEIALARTERLFIGLGNVLHRDDRRTLALFKEAVGKAKSRRDKRAPDYALGQAVSLLGSLLYAINSKVEDYMNESAYQMGQLLAAMDELHRCYGIAARDGDVPATLIGNGLLGRAADSPALALEELLDRSRIYVGWAKTASIPDNEAKRIAVHSAKKLLRVIQPIARALHEDPSLNKPLEAAQKAHLFLGYLAPVLGKDRDRAPDNDKPDAGFSGGVNEQSNSET